MKKDYAVSSIRMIATILVVVLHIFQQMERTNPDIHIATDWLNLGLVLFFGISGFLYSGRKIGGGGVLVPSPLQGALPAQHDSRYSHAGYILGNI